MSFRPAATMHTGPIISPGPAEATPSGTAIKTPASVSRSLASRLLDGRGWTLVSLGSDAAFLALAMAAAAYGAPAWADAGDGRLLVALPFLVVPFLVLRGVYGRKLQTEILTNIAHVAAATSLAVLLLLAATALLGQSDESAPLLARAYVFATVYLVGAHTVLALIQRRARRAGIVGKPTLIVGAGQIASQVERRLEQNPELGLRPVGYLDADPPPEELVPYRRAPVLGAPESLAEVAEATGARHVILAFLSARDHDLLPLIRESEARGIEVSVVPRLFDSMSVRVYHQRLGGLPLFGLRRLDPKGSQFATKHVLDRLLAALLIVVTFPVLLGAAAAIKLSSPGPVLFRQRRIGRDGRDFQILKFRTMHAPLDMHGLDAETIASIDRAPGGIEGADRRTRVGALLRRISLDELPQLFSVMKGDMSIVGPRPERPEYVETFGQAIRRYDDRHRVKSGITGWAQVHGLRGQTSLRDRVEWDNYYIENWSLWLDLKILLMTFGAVLRSPD